MRLRPILPIAVLLASGSSLLWVARPDAEKPTPPEITKSGKARAVAAFGNLPLSFEPNRGQAKEPVAFLSRGAGYTAFLTPTEAVLDLRREDKRAALRIQFAGANRTPRMTGLEELPGRSNYFLGNDPDGWQASVPRYRRVAYRNVYPGIDLIFYGNRRQLEFDFMVSPGADPGAIELKLEGMDGLHLGEDGAAVLQTAAGDLRLQAPNVFQMTGGEKQQVAAAYTLNAPDRLGFRIASYDTARPLVIDPVLVYATYFGGSDDDRGLGIAVDGSGNIYVTGRTSSLDFPTASPLQAAKGGLAEDAFVAKLAPDGSSLVYSTYLGGSGFDSTGSIAVDSAGNAYVTGITFSSDFPTTPGAFQPAIGGDPCGSLCLSDGFVTKLSADGSALVYSTYLGAADTDAPATLTVDAAGSAYVVGETRSPDFPTTPGAFQETLAGGAGTPIDGFVTKLSPDGTALAYSTYLGGANSIDSPVAVAVDVSGNAYVTGHTFSDDFPTTTGAFQPTAAGTNLDAFITKLDPAGATQIYSTYLGGAEDEFSLGIAVDSAGNAHVAGFTLSTDFPTAVPLQDTNLGQWDAFVTKTNAAGDALVYSTYLGGTLDDFASAIAVDSAGNAYVTGNTDSADFPTVAPLQAAHAGVSDLFVTKLSPDGSAMLFSTFLGGTGVELSSDTNLALDLDGNLYVTGVTSSPDFPTVSPLQSAFPGVNSALVAKISPAGAAGVALGPGSLDFGNQAVGFTSPARTITLTNAGSLPLTITAEIAAAGDYAQTNDCGGSVAPGASCTLSVTFSPATTGTLNGSITISDDAAGNPHVVPLTGTGVVPVPEVLLIPPSVDFGPQAITTTSAPAVVTLTSAGTGNLVITTVGLTGANPAEFAIGTDTCSGATLAPKATCTVEVTFTPAAVGDFSAGLTFTDDAGDSPQTVPLTGSGFIPAPEATLTPASLNFGGQAVTTTSEPEDITLTNSGTADLNVATVTLTGTEPGDFAIDADACTGALLTPGSTCIVSVTFTPTALGAHDARLTFTDDAADSPQKAILDGAGIVDFVLSADPDSVTVKAGKDATYTITVDPIGGSFDAGISFFCSGVPDLSECSLSPATVVPGEEPATSTMTITTTAGSNLIGQLPPGTWPALPPAFFLLLGLAALALLPGVLAARLPKKQWKWLTAAATMGLLLLLSACAGEGKQKDPGTPRGTSTITVTGFSAALSHTIEVTLIVQ